MKWGLFRSLCWICSVLFITSCVSNNQKTEDADSKTISTDRSYAQQFKIENDQVWVQQHNEWIEVPANAQRIVVLSSAYCYPLFQVDALSKIVGVAQPQFIYNETIKVYIEENETPTIGLGKTFSIEAILALQPDLVLTDPYTNTGGLSKFVPVVAIAPYLEKSPLAQAEWLRFFGSVTGQQSLSDSIFKSIQTQYVEVKHQINSLEDAPKVLLNLPMQGTWYMSGGESIMAQLIKDAGGEYLWSDHKGANAIPLNQERVIERAKQADFWLNPSDCQTYACMNNKVKLLELIPAYQHQQCYNYHKRQSENGNVDFFESGAYRPDLVLQDLVHIFNQENLNELYYFERLME